MSPFVLAQTEFCLAKFLMLSGLDVRLKSSWSSPKNFWPKTGKVIVFEATASTFLFGIKMKFFASKIQNQLALRFCKFLAKIGDNFIKAA